MSHIQRLKEIQSSLYLLEDAVESLIADMEKDKEAEIRSRKPIIERLDDLNRINALEAAADNSTHVNDINGKILASKLSWSDL
jgi:hypothetical protein